jgi:predicted metal-binding membrane protein
MTDRTYLLPTKDRLAILAALALICGLAWAYLFRMSWGMQHMDADMAIMPRMVSWEPADLALVFLMWTIMMVAMMLPSATPMILLFAAVGRRLERPQTAAHVAVFTAAYVATWAAFSLLATLMQWGLLEARLVSPMMDESSPVLGGVLLVAAGTYQFTSQKDACLSRCRSPLVFMTTHWRSRARGAFIMGAQHGLYCLGCCWLLMLLLFVLGVMNVLWIAALSAFVLLEKTLPHAAWFKRLGGVAFIVWGGVLLAPRLFG